MTKLDSFQKFKFGLILENVLRSSRKRNNRYNSLKGRNKTLLFLDGVIFYVEKTKELQITHEN